MEYKISSWSHHLKAFLVIVLLRNSYVLVSFVLHGSTSLWMNRDWFWGDTFNFSTAKPPSRQPSSSPTPNGASLYRPWTSLSRSWRRCYEKTVPGFHPKPDHRPGRNLPCPVHVHRHRRHESGRIVCRNPIPGCNNVPAIPLFHGPYVHHQRDEQQLLPPKPFHNRVQEVENSLRSCWYLPPSESSSSAGCREL